MCKSGITSSSLDLLGTGSFLWLVSAEFSLLNSGLFLSCDGFIMTKASSTSLDSPVLSGSSADFTLLGGTGDSSTESFDTGWLWEAISGGGGGG